MGLHYSWQGKRSLTPADSKRCALCHRLLIYVAKVFSCYSFRNVLLRTQSESSFLAEPLLRKRWLVLPPPHDWVASSTCKWKKCKDNSEKEYVSPSMCQSWKVPYLIMEFLFKSFKIMFQKNSRIPMVMINLITFNYFIKLFFNLFPISVLWYSWKHFISYCFTCNLQSVKFKLFCLVFIIQKP